MVRGVLAALVEVNYWYFKLAGYDLLRLLGGYLNMNELAIARAIHILSIVIWIGGVAFVTMVLIPVIRQSPYKHDQMEIFNGIENRFAFIARFTVLLAGISGFYMVYQLSAWQRFSDARYFWMHAMVFIWLMFIFALFVIEPFFIKNHGRLIKDGNGISDLKKTQTVHAVIFILSVITIFISVLGAHGVLN